MPVFEYKARDRGGRLLSGSFESGSRDAVAEQLEAQGCWPVSIAEKKDDLLTSDLSGFLARFQTVTENDRLFFTRQLHSLLSAGVPFSGSFSALITQTENPKLKVLLGQVQRDVEGGLSFSQALERHSDVFDGLYISMIGAGEQAGVLDTILERLVQIGEHEQETRQRIKAATRYPKIVISGMVLAFVILMIFVVPTFAKMYGGAKVSLPLPTRIMIGTNNLFMGYWWLMLAAAGGGWYTLKRVLATPIGRERWDGWKLRIPLFGPIFLKSALSRFALIFAILSRSGLPVLQILDVVSKTVGNTVLSKLIVGISDAVKEGANLSNPMKEAKLFPPVVLQMVAVGEETGQLDKMLMNVSHYYDREVDYSLKTLSSALEPILLLVIGTMVLLLALAIFMPWWDMMKVFKGGS
ncbi:MAG: type II secretion system F family protein [Nitrospirae bacterium]|nr:type II secretion system F family protein [Nitrospirota bacterium]